MIRTHTQSLETLAGVGEAQKRAPTSRSRHPGAGRRGSDAGPRTRSTGRGLPRAQGGLGSLFLPSSSRTSRSGLHLRRGPPHSCSSASRAPPGPRRADPPSLRHSGLLVLLARRRNPSSPSFCSCLPHPRVLFPEHAAPSSRSLWLRVVGNPAAGVGQCQVEWVHGQDGGDTARLDPSRIS